MTGDGAKENIKVFKTLAMEAVSIFIEPICCSCYPNALTAGVFDRKLTMLHPITLEPIFLQEDMPHVLKRVFNAMEKSSMEPVKRPLQHGFCPTNLHMICQLWELSGG